MKNCGDVINSVGDFGILCHGDHLHEMSIFQSTRPNIPVM